MYNTFLDGVDLEFVPRNVLRPGKSWPDDLPRHRRRTPITQLAPEPSQERVWPVTADIFATECLNFPIDAKQREILSGTREQSRRTIVNCSRQWGKSTTAALKAVHHALTNSGCLVLVASFTLNQAGELLDKAIQFARTLELPIRRVPGHPSSLLLPNGSRIIGIPGRPASIRGYSAVSLLIVDEAAYVPDALYEALRPMLATTNGDIWLLSTPNGQTGFFHREWQDTKQSWRKFSVPANECPRINADFLAEERRKLGPAQFDREYMCKFSSANDAYFDVEAMQTATAHGTTYSAPPGEVHRATRFYVGFDLGDQQSHSAIVILERAQVVSKDRDPVNFAFLQRHEIHLRRAITLPLKIGFQRIAQALSDAIESLPNSKDVTLIVDATGGGAPFVDIVKKFPIAGLLMPVMITSGGKYTISSGTHRVPKTDLMSSLNYVITSPDFKVNARADEFQAVMRELENVRSKTTSSGSLRFLSTERDDLVMAFALAAWPARKFLDQAPTPAGPSKGLLPLY